MKFIEINRTLAGLLRLAFRPTIYSFILMITACSYVPFGALSALSGVDILRVDAEELRVAVVSSDTIRFAGPPQLVLETVIPDRSTVVARVMFFEAEQDDLTGIPKADPTRRVQVYKSDPAQAAVWREFQNRVLAFKAAGVRGRVDASVDAKVCRGAVAASSGEIDIFLRVSTIKGYVRVLGNVPSSKLVTAFAPSPETAQCL